MSISVVIVGCGARGGEVYGRYFRDNGHKIVALCDANNSRLEAFSEEFGVSGDKLFRSYDELFSCGKIADVCVVSVFDNDHYDVAMKAMALGYDLLLEKPVSGDVKECLAIRDYAKSHGRTVAVCHVMRYTSYYRYLKKVIDDGRLGDLRGIEQTEDVAYWHMAHAFVRGNFRNSDETSPMILQKCCHDMDLLVWLTGRKPSVVTSMGDLSYFNRAHAPEGHAKRCVDCGVKDCPFNAVDFYIGNYKELKRTGRPTNVWPYAQVAVEPDEERLTEALKTGPWGRCVYECDNNVVDRQWATIRFADGTYTLAVDIPFEDASETEYDKIALAMGGEIDDTRVYALGTIEVKNGVKIGSDNTVVTTYDKIGDVELDKNSVYTITFRYMPHMDMNNFSFGNNDSYHFYIESKKLGVTAGDYYWQDISSEAGTKTVTVTTGNASDYKIKIESINFDAIGIDKVWIEKKSAVSENFESYDIEDDSTIIYPVFYGAAEVATVMDGSCLELSTLNTAKKYLLAKTDRYNLELKKGKVYTVTFDFKAGGDVGDGGYYFLAVGDGDSESRELTSDFDVIGEWYERDDTFVTKKTFSFICTEDNQAIYFGLNTVGSYYIDNLIIVDSDSSAIIEGVDVGFRHNVIPEYTEIGLGKTETFAKGTFQASGFNWGQYAWGRITFNPNEIPGYDAENNTSALLGRVEKEAYDPKIDNVWFEFARSKREYYPFEANKLYCVEFDYKILKTFSSDNVFCFFRDDSLADRFAEAVNYPIDLTAYQSGNVSYLQSAADLTTGKGTGTDYHYKQYWLLGDHDEYQFMFCMHGLWEISIDNIYIYEVNAQGEKIN